MKRDYTHWSIKYRNSQYESMFDIQMVNWKIDPQNSQWPKVLNIFMLSTFTAVLCIVKLVHSVHYSLSLCLDCFKYSTVFQLSFTCAHTHTYGMRMHVKLKDFVKWKCLKYPIGDRGSVNESNTISFILIISTNNTKPDIIGH